MADINFSEILANKKALHDHLVATDEHYRAYHEAHAIETPAASGFSNSTASGEATLRFNLPEGYGDVHDQIKRDIEIRAGKSDHKIPDNLKPGAKADVTSEHIIDHFHGVANNIDQNLVGESAAKWNERMNGLTSQLDAQYRAGTIDKDTHTKLTTALTEHGTALQADVVAVGEAAKKEAAAIKQHVGSKLEPAKPVSPLAGGASVAGSTAGDVLGKKGFVGAFEYNKLKDKPVQRIIRDISSNAQHSWGGLAKVTAGLGGVLYFGTDAFKTVGNMMSGDPEKQADASWGKLFIDGLGVAGGLTLARWNGMKAAAGSHYSLGA